MREQEMNYYKDNQNNVFAYSDIQTPKNGLTKITEQEALELTNPPPTIEELFDTLRRVRDGRISAVLWMRERHADELELGKETTLTPEQYTELLTYIQSLRDLPAQPGAPWDGGGELTPWSELPKT